MKKAGQLVTGPDAILNEIYMTAHMKKMRRRKDSWWVFSGVCVRF